MKIEINFFDIDKLSVYWNDSENLFNNKFKDYNLDNNYSKKDLFNILLQLESKILLHPRNAHMLFMPVIDDLLKKDAFKQIVVDGQGKSKDSTTFLQALTPQKNVEKAIQFIKSKLGVGTVALDITGHSVFGSQNITVNKTYNNPSNDFKPEPTNLLFEGLENNYSLNSMYDASNRIISEVQSQTMNSQVDAGKDPYAVLLGINNQTLGIMMYLVRRQVPVVTVLKFLSQPLIQAYLIEQRKNESVINKQRGDEASKDDLISRIYNKFNLKRHPLNRTVSITDNDLTEGFKKIDPRQGHYFEYFLALVDETGAFNDLKNGITVDTKGKKDKAAVEAFEALWERIDKTFIIPQSDLNILKQESVLAPFFKAQKLYRQIYSPFYAIDNSVFGDRLKMMKELLGSRQKGNYRKEKIRSLVDNDFLLYLIQNYHPDFSNGKFDELFGFGEQESLPEMIKNLASNEAYSKNPVIKAMFPLISVDKDSATNKRFDVIRMFERELSTIDLNDFIDAMKDIRDEISEDLYKKIIQLGINQAGFNNSPFSLNKIFPTFKSSVRSNGNLVDFENDYLREIQVTILRMLPELQTESETILSNYFELFVRNNPEYLPKKYYSKSAIKYFYTYSPSDKKKHLFYKDNSNTNSVFLSVLGGTYFKRYFNNLVQGLGAPKEMNKQKEVEVVTPKRDGRIIKVISGGQTGIDRLGLEVAYELGIETGGTTTPGFITETGKDMSLKDKFNVQEITPDIQKGRSGKEFYLPRTEQNVINSDGTVYFATDEDSAGKIATERFSKQYKKPFILNPNTEELIKWMSQNNIKILNVAGNRGSKISFEQLQVYKQILVNALKSGYDIQPQQLSLFADDTFNTDEMNEAEQLKEQCKGSTKNIVK